LAGLFGPFNTGGTLAKQSAPGKPPLVGSAGTP